MDPLPPIEFSPADWPDAREDGSTVLTPEFGARFLGLLTALINYLETQHARCATPR